VPCAIECVAGADIQTGRIAADAVTRWGRSQLRAPALAPLRGAVARDGRLSLRATATERGAC
jgi:hypothetical protein